MNKTTKAEDLNFLKIQTCVLKVSIHCEGCKKKVKKLLQKIDGVYTIAIDAEQGKVTVNGNVNPSTLIQKLNKAGKPAELWPAKNNGAGGFDLSRQVPKLVGDTAKGQQKPLKGSEEKDNKLQPLQKELKDMKFPVNKEEKSVKLPAFVQEFEDGSEFDDEFDEDEDDFDETDDSVGGSDDDRTILKPAPKNIAPVKQNSGGVKSKTGEGKSHGLEAVASSGFVPKELTAAATVTGGNGVGHQQQQVAEMMQQQRMMTMMTNGYPMAYGYPMPRSESYTNYFSDENTGGGCGIM